LERIVGLIERRTDVAEEYRQSDIQEGAYGVAAGSTAWA
jgi:hypothetical protein